MLAAAAVLAALAERDKPAAATAGAARIMPRLIPEAEAAVIALVLALALGAAGSS